MSFKKGLFALLTDETIDRVVETATNKAQLIEQLNAKIKTCKKCKLHETKTNYVPGEGDIDAVIMFIGEAPGYDEDIQGKPFVGRAGKLLTKMIEAIDLKREEVFICNVLKCRPPNNRNPHEDEIEACAPYLKSQIQIIKPSLIFTLGNFATQFILNTKMGITKLRGKIHEIDGIKVIPSYHPSALLRRPALKKESWEDLKLLRREYDKITGKRWQKHPT